MSTHMIKTADLSGAVLDWAVAICEGKEDGREPSGFVNYAPSTNWAQGGPIIENNHIHTEEVWADVGDVPDRLRQQS